MQAGEQGGHTQQWHGRFTSLKSESKRNLAAPCIHACADRMPGRECLVEGTQQDPCAMAIKGQVGLTETLRTCSVLVRISMPRHRYVRLFCVQNFLTATPPKEQWGMGARVERRRDQPHTMCLIKLRENPNCLCQGKACTHTWGAATARPACTHEDSAGCSAPHRFRGAAPPAPAWSRTSAGTPARRRTPA